MQCTAIESARLFCFAVSELTRQSMKPAHTLAHVSIPPPLFFRTVVFFAPGGVPHPLTPTIFLLNLTPTLDLLPLTPYSPPMRNLILPISTLTVALTMGAAHGIQDFFLVLATLFLYWIYGDDAPVRTHNEGPFDAE